MNLYKHIITIIIGIAAKSSVFMTAICLYPKYYPNCCNIIALQETAVKCSISRDDFP